MERGQGDYGLSDGRWLELDWAPLIERVEVESELGCSEIEFVSVGEGPAIVLIHGLAGSWRNWLENIPRLADRHRVVALDLPGFGASPLPQQEITMPGYGSVVAELVRFPRAPHDDDVDACTQALSRLSRLMDHAIVFHTESAPSRWA